MPNNVPIACPDITRYSIHSHAIDQMTRRGITRNELAAVLDNPGQREAGQNGRCLYQLRVFRGDPPKENLIRVVVDVQEDPPLVITVYATSKVKKYWRTE